MGNRRKSGYSLSVVLILMLAAAVVSGSAVYAWQNFRLAESGADHDVKQESKVLRETVQARADGALHALKDKDMAKLAEYVHPEKGVRFSPYSSVTEKDVAIAATQLPKAWADSSERLWGSYDGSGEPIELTFGEYFDKFVYAKDYLEAPEIVFNEAVQRGNSINNIKKAFPDSACIEYYFPGSEKQYEGMDWRSLTLVFEQKGGTWYLTGVVNNQWTI